MLFHRFSTSPKSSSFLYKREEERGEGKEEGGKKKGNEQSNKSSLSHYPRDVFIRNERNCEATARNRNKRNLILLEWRNHCDIFLFSSLTYEEDTGREDVGYISLKEKIKNEHSSPHLVNKDMKSFPFVTIFDLDLKNLFYIITSTVSNFSLRESRQIKKKKKRERERRRILRRKIFQLISI